MTVINLLIVRHGETAHNRPPRVIQGHLDTLLNETGLEQAEKLSLRLQTSLQLLDCQFDQIYCSDLIRTKQTLEPFLSLNEKTSLNVVYDNQIREMDAGALTGVPLSKAYELLLENESFDDLLARTGESAEQLRTRLEKWLVKVLSEAWNKVGGQPYNLLAMTHGGVIKTMCQILLPNRKHCMANNTAIFHFTFTVSLGENFHLPKARRNLSVQLFNCTQHLEDQAHPSLPPKSIQNSYCIPLKTISAEEKIDLVNKQDEQDSSSKETPFYV